MQHYWILLVLSAAFLNALWVSQSKKVLSGLPPDVFTFMFRGLSALLLLPTFLYDVRHHMSFDPVFLAATAMAGFLEVLRITLQSVGVKEDFYGTFSVYNTSPLFTLLLAPAVLSEKINGALIAGVVCIVVGAMTFYRMSRRVSLIGLTCAVCSGVAAVLSKVAIQRSSAYVYCFLAYFIGSSALSVVPHQYRQFHATEGKKLQLIKILPIAFYSTLATLFYYLAIGMAPVTKVNALVRTNLIFGFLLSVFFLKEKEDLVFKAVGALFILAGAWCVVLA